ncbi:cellulose binding domain-containing protein [Streptosporangium sandarakinum]|uniref:cellulose binding domain-containing protein n=1 Tax=Streptosporangium sandarakinum TaxID=1260955 RepID=UPI0036AAF28A
MPPHGTVVYRVSGGASPSATPTVTPTATPTATPTPGGQDGCTATYRLAGDWGSGFQGEVTVRNTGSAPLNGWAVKMTLPGGQTITNLWNGVNTGTGGTVTVRNAPYNGTVAGNGSATFGFTADGSGSAAPTGMTCTSP